LRFLNREGDMKIKSAWGILVCAAAVLLVLPLAASADPILVTGADLTGFRTFNTNLTPPPVLPGGVVAADGWADAYPGGFKISWVITSPGSGHQCLYSYTITDEDGSALNPDISHFILEVSPFITPNNVSQYIFNVPEVTWFFLYRPISQTESGYFYVMV
jgi:hypothetical protein